MVYLLGLLKVFCLDAIAIPFSLIKFLKITKIPKRPSLIIKQFDGC